MLYSRHFTEVKLTSFISKTFPSTTAIPEMKHALNAPFSTSAEQDINKTKYQSQGSVPVK